MAAGSGKRPLFMLPTEGMTTEQMKAAVWEALTRALQGRDSDPPASTEPDI